MADNPFRLFILRRQLDWTMFRLNWNTGYKQWALIGAFRGWRFDG